LDPSDFEYIASDRWPDRIQSWPSHGDNASLLAFRTAPEVRRDERIDGDRYVVGRWINSHGKSPFLIGKPRFLLEMGVITRGYIGIWINSLGKLNGDFNSD
jgi:hypothetical protein